MNNYHLYEEIGRGKMSMVYKARKRHTIRHVAVKSIEKQRRDKVMTEVRVMRQLQHVNVVSFINWYETRNHLWIINEYCAGGDLLHLLKQDIRLPEDQVRRFGRDMVSGLLHIHASAVIHSDLKPSNMLLNEDGLLKLCDFGYALSLKDVEQALAESQSLPRRGTPHYMAPELFLEGGMHSFASDLWAIGCVLNEMLCGKPPFVASSFAQLQQLVAHEPTQVPPDASNELQDILAELLQKNLLERPAWDSLRSHGFWLGQLVGDDGDAQRVPSQPHLQQLEKLRRFGVGSSAGDERRLEERTIPSSWGHTEARALPPQTGEMDAEDWDHAQRPERHTARSQCQRALVPPTRVESPVMSSGLRARIDKTAYVFLRELLLTVDTGVRPISRNPQIEEPEPLDQLPELPFPALPLEDLCARPQQEVDAFLGKVYKCIAQSSLEQRIGALKYLEQICRHMNIADAVVNSPLFKLVLRALQTRRSEANGRGSNSTPPPILRARLLSLVGQLLRHATYLDPVTAELGLFSVLCDGLAERDTQLRRRSAAALGELLFYVATQHGGAGAPPSSSWRVQQDVPRALVHVLSSLAEDEVVQHYAAKTVENIATQCPAMAQQWFFSTELLRALNTHVRRSTWDPFRLSCFGALAHLLREAEAEPSDPEVLEVALTALSPQSVPSALLLLSMAMLRAASLEAAKAEVPASTLDHLINIVSQPRYNMSLRSRAAVLLCILFTLDKPSEVWQLRAALDRALIPNIDRLGREKDGFVVQCMTMAMELMETTVAAMLECFVSGLRQLLQAGDNAEQQAKELIHTPSVLLNLLNSATLSRAVLSPTALPKLGAACKLAAAAHSPQSAQHSAFGQLQTLILAVMETLCAQQALLLEQAPQVVRSVLEPLVNFLQTPRRDVRIFALKAFSDVCILFINDGHIFDPAADPPSDTTRLMEALLCGRVLPQLSGLLRDEPPAPSCAMRLLAALLARGSAEADRAVSNLGLANHVLAILHGQPALSHYSAQLTRCLLRGRHVRIQDLEAARAFDAVHTALAAQAAVGNAAQMDLVTVDEVLLVLEEALLQTLEAHGSSGWDPRSLGLGPLLRAQPFLAALSATLATHAQLTPLLDRATACAQHLVELSWKGHPQVAALAPEGLAALLEALARTTRWQSVDVPDSGMFRAVQRRMLSVLRGALRSPGGTGIDAEVRAQLATGVERLLRERSLGDTLLVAEARLLVAEAVGRGL